MTKEIRAYLFLTSLVICGLAASIVTAPKVVHLEIDFPFSNIVFSMLTYPVVDCICELWGKKMARQSAWLALFCQVLIMLIIQISIVMPSPSFWTLQPQYQTILGSGAKVVLASIAAFGASQALDIFVYQRLKEASHGKWLWLRSNASTYFGQALDSLIFVLIVFAHSPQKWGILEGSILVKLVLSLLMTPFVYLIVISVNRYLGGHTLAFKT